MDRKEKESQPEKPAQLTPEQFSRVSDSLVDYQIPPKIFADINKAVKNNQLVVFLVTHQSYFDIEAYRHICEQINQGQENPIESYLIYSSPAVGLNIGGLLKSREEVYKGCHLNMLGVVRTSDRTDPKYKDNITPKLEEESLKNSSLYGQKTKEGGCISFIPFEATLKSGRINPETGNIFGMREVTNNVLLLSAIRQKALIIPCGIDGSYKVVDPVEHKLSESFKEAIFLRNPPKIITLKTGEPMDLSLSETSGKKTHELYHQATLGVAKLVSAQAQGEYAKYLAA